jgi:hypothetical protein
MRAYPVRVNDIAPVSAAPPRTRGGPLDAVVRRLAELLDSGPYVQGDATSAWCEDVVIVEPGDPVDGLAGAAVLGVGARGHRAAALVTAAAGAGASAVALRVTGDGPDPAVCAAAGAAGIVLIGIPAELRWDRAEAEFRAALAQRPEAGGHGGDLFALAQTVATLTGGVVSVEDGAHRVVAYAGPGEEADAVRRSSILGRACPEPYLEVLRQLGVYRRVRAADAVVAVPARPELGARRRMVVGVNAAHRPLGTIWVQEGAEPLAPQTERTLLGAARLAATQLVDHYFQGDAGARLASREELSHGLLTGRFDPGSLAAHLGVDPAASATVAVVDLRLPEDLGAVRADALRAEAAGVMSVHAAALRADALVVQACGQIYAILPEPVAGGIPRQEAADGGLERWADELVGTLRRLTGTGVQAVLAGRAERLAGIPEVKLRGHRALEVLARTPEVAVGTHAGLTPALLVRDALELLGGAAGSRFPAVRSLVEHDRVNGTELARSLLGYLDAFGDVATVAARLTVHPNTLRYRVRRAVALTGLDLDDAEHRLAAMLHLRLELGAP